MDLEIRYLTKPDFVAANEIIKLAFGTPDSRIADLERYCQLQPDGWLLALMDNTPVGMVGAVRYGNFSYVGMMVVHPTHQRKGVGRALMRELLGQLDRGEDPMQLLDATEKGAPLYYSLGFKGDGKALTYQATDRQDLKVPEIPAGIDITPMLPADLPVVSEIDTLIFGANRSPVLRFFLEDFPQRAFLARSHSGEILGYLFAQQQKIGPWAALSKEGSQALLNRALSLSFEKIPTVVLPDQNINTVTLLEECGFSYQKSHLHMRRGGNSHPGHRDQINGQASFALG